MVKSSIMSHLLGSLKHVVLKSVGKKLKHRLNRNRLSKYNNIIMLFYIAKFFVVKKQKMQRMQNRLVFCLR